MAKKLLALKVPKDWNVTTATGEVTHAENAGHQNQGNRNEMLQEGFKPVETQTCKAFGFIRPSAPIIEDWDTDSDNDSVFRPKTNQTKPKFTKINFVKFDENMKSVNKENTHKQVEYPKKSQIPKAVATKSRHVPVNAAKQNSPRAATSISTAMPVNTTAPKSKVAAESLIPSPPVDFPFNHLLLLYSIIMANLPPLNNSPNVPENEQAPAAPAGFDPQWIGGHNPNNNNGWIEEDDEDEVYNPYKEADPLNRPPSSPETAKREIMNAPITWSTLQPIPPIRVKPLTKQMWDRFRVESSSSRRLERIDMRMDSFDDDLTALDSTFREQMQEMKKLVAGLNEQFQQIQGRDLRAENEILRIRLRVAKERAEYNHMEAELRNQLPLKRRNRETPYDPSTNLASRPRRADPYVMVRDNAVHADVAGDRGGESIDTTAVVKDAGEEKDDEGDAVTAKDSQPSESRGSPRDL
ncbi:hypothetical protein Tco_0414250 [Tanacetum coccineum]